MRLPEGAHNAQPWRIHAIAPDFRLEDVWQLVATDDSDCFLRIVSRLAAGDASRNGSVAVRALFAFRWRLGALLRWDRQDSGIASRTPSLVERLPADLLAGPRGPRFERLPFRPLYLTDDEFAAEIANATMHGVMHVGRVSDPRGARIQMAVLVKPNGLLGNAYMAAIKPFRRLVVYPELIRQLGRSARIPVADSRPARL